MPIGAFISSYEKMQTLTENPILGHITTFGGHPVVCAAADACLTVLRSENWIVEANQKGAILEKMLLEDSAILEIRRAGLMYAIDMESFDRVKKVVDRCRTAAARCRASADQLYAGPPVRCAAFVCFY